jgi:hypothetical protein
VLKAGPGHQNVITTDLVDDLLLSAENLKTFKSTFNTRVDWGASCPSSAPRAPPTER